MSDDITAGELLQVVRKRNGKSQRQVSVAPGMTTSSISRWESGKQNIPGCRAHEIAQAYGMNEEEERQLISLCGGVRPSSKQINEPEYRVFYALILLPKEARDRVIKAARAYESASEEK